MTTGERTKAKRRASTGLYRVCREIYETDGSVVNGIIEALERAGLRLEKELFAPNCASTRSRPTPR
jgi:hypothetical protein